LPGLLADAKAMEFGEVDAEDEAYEQTHYGYDEETDDAKDGTRTRERLATPASFIFRPGQVYLMIAGEHEQGGADGEDDPGGRTAVMKAQTAIAPKIRMTPGRIGTMMPSRPTRMTRRQRPHRRRS